MASSKPTPPHTTASGRKAASESVTTGSKPPARAKSGKSGEQRVSATSETLEASGASRKAPLSNNPVMKGPTSNTTLPASKPSKPTVQTSGNATRPAASRSQTAGTAPSAAPAKEPATLVPQRVESETAPESGTRTLPDEAEIDRLIAEAAYYRAEIRNFEPGWEHQDWLAAKEEVMARLQERKA